MSKTCIVTGKKTASGRTRKHNYGGGWEFRATAKPAKWRVNFKKIKIIDANGNAKRVWMSVRGLKTLKKTA
ncbi:50S ribosomal protein L28 [bacterium]|nr:MAG: 50S ribosomal protein L28 [bacterium]